MEITQRLTSFFIIASKDQRLLTSHVCIYAALCSVCACAGGHCPFSINRREIMQACKILGNATYHKCMRDLRTWGYIEYLPSYHPVLGSLVTLNDFAELIKV
jgi:hypothetical protein